jgi:hypothetical protein
LFTLGGDGWLVCGETENPETGFAGSEVVLPEVACVVPVEMLAQARFAPLQEAAEDAYELAGKHVLDWVAACWQTAGGQAFPLEATVGFADDAERLDLRTGTWLNH